VVHLVAHPVVAVELVYDKAYGLGRLRTVPFPCRLDRKMDKEERQGSGTDTSSILFIFLLCLPDPK
jgi:hypothetical protein